MPETTSALLPSITCTSVAYLVVAVRVNFAVIAHRPDISGPMALAALPAIVQFAESTLARLAFLCDDAAPSGTGIGLGHGVAVDHGTRKRVSGANVDGCVLAELVFVVADDLPGAGRKVVPVDVEDDAHDEDW